MDNRQKLAALDLADLTVLSSLLQDATVLVGDMGYDAEAEQFMLVAARFITEDGHNRRRLMGVNIDGVKRARRYGIDLNRKEDVLSLLSVTFSGMSVDLTFSGDAMLTLETDQIRVFAADLDEGWVTGFQPSHNSD
ncbi:MAG: DUF2948 family protein [Alphaproteobacteria bacterium]|nr:DUF2948 family protein [Alphaproteobacteria bacterium]